jgi:hypothetical protein
MVSTDLIVDKEGDPMSDRRQFLKAVGAIVIAPAIPVPRAEAPVCKEKEKWAANSLYVKDDAAWHVNFVKELKLSFHA